MTDISTKIVKSSKFLLILNTIESLILIVVLLSIAKDPKNAWLFGYSKSRVFVIGSVLGYLFVLLIIMRSSSWLTKNTKRLLEIFQNHPSTDIFIELSYGIWFLILIASSYYLCSILIFSKSLESIHIRIIPIIVFIIVVFFQVFVFSIYLRLVLEGENLKLRNALRYCTFPSIREKINTLCFNTIPSILEKIYSYIDSVVSQVSTKRSKLFLSVIFIFTPTLITFALIFFIFKTTPLTHIPASPDQVNYWHQTQTFIDYGFSGGQYSLYEMPAPAEFSRFGGHGPAIPVIYGIFGKFIGWEYYTAVLINFFLITLALVIFVLLGNPDKKQLFCGIIMLGTYWPLLLYLPTNMAESLNHAIAIVVAVFFYLHMNSKGNNKILTVSVFVILIVSIMIRVTWSLLFFPFFIFTIVDYKPYKFIGALLLSVVGVLLAFIYTKFLYSPYPLVFESLLNGQSSLQELFFAVETQLRINLKYLIREPDTLIFIQAFRYQIILISVILIYKLIRYFVKGDQSIKGLIRSDLSFHFLNIVVPFIGVLTLFEVVDTRDYRNLAVSLLLSLLVLLLFSRYKYIYPFILVNGLLIFSFIPGFAQQRDNNFIYDKERIEAFSASMSKYVVFDETKDNRWCNTLGFMKGLASLFPVDSGIGLSIIDDVSENTKSKYLLLPDEYVDSNLSKIETLDLLELEKTSIGILYLNPHSACE